MLLSPLPVLPPKWTVPLFIKKKKVLFAYLAVSGLLASRGIFSSWRLDSVVMAYGLSCSMACGILVPQPDIGPVCPALHGRFLTSGPPGKKSQEESLC